MKAYFLWAEGQSPTHKSIALIAVPVDGFTACYAQHFETPSKQSWRNRAEWRVQSPPDDPNAQNTLTALMVGVQQAGTVPFREWSVEVPDNIVADPLKNFPLGSAQAPISKWIDQMIMEIDGTDPSVGSRIPANSADGHADFLRKRAKDIRANALGGIVLHTKPVGQRNAVKVAPMKGVQQYTRPNGKVYYSRNWGGHTDVLVLRKARDTKQPVLLLSPPGTGKTAAIEAAYGDDLYTVNGSADTTARDLVGTYVPLPDKTYMWVDGPAVKAAEEGKVLFIDEVGLVDPKELSSIYSLMDGRDVLDVTANPARAQVRAKKGFFVVGATNPKAPGVRLSEALLSRFTVQAEMTTDYKVLREIIGVNGEICRVAENLAQMQKEGDVSWAPQFRELEAFNELEKTFGYQFALSNLMSSVPEQDMDEVTEAFNSAIGAHVDPARIV